MAAKHCPGCNKQVPVACKKCLCGHVFFTTRRPAKGGKRDDPLPPRKERIPSGSKNYLHHKIDDDDDDIPLATLRQLKQEEADLPRRRTGRIQREKPNFYDALEYDNEMRKKRRILKGGKSKDEVNAKEPGGPGGNSSEDIVPIKDSKSEPSGAVQQPKKRRGRPPRLTTTKTTKSKTNPTPLPLNNKTKQQPKDSANGVGGVLGVDNEDMMKGISPEKALQFNIILEDLNRKWVNVGWRA